MSDSFKPSLPSTQEEASAPSADTHPVAQEPTRRARPPEIRVSWVHLLSKDLNLYDDPAEMRNTLCATLWSLVRREATLQGDRFFHSRFWFRTHAGTPDDKQQLYCPGHIQR